MKTTAHKRRSRRVRALERLEVQLASGVRPRNGSDEEPHWTFSLTNEDRTRIRREIHTLQQRTM